MKSTLDSRGFPACVGATHEQHAASNQNVELRTSLAMPSYPPPRLRILVLDEDDDCRGVLTRFLRSKGHIVEPASCSKDALAIFQPGRFQLIITDLDTPETTEDEFTTAIKAASPDQPIVKTTAWAVSCRHRLMQQANYLLPKPFGLEELRQTIAAATAPNSPTLDGSAQLTDQPSEFLVARELAADPIASAHVHHWS